MLIYNIRRERKFPRIITNLAAPFLKLFQSPSYLTKIRITAVVYLLKIAAISKKYKYLKILLSSFLNKWKDFYLDHMSICLGHLYMVICTRVGQNVQSLPLILSN